MRPQPSAHATAAAVARIQAIAGDPFGANVSRANDSTIAWNDASGAYRARGARWVATLANMGIEIASAAAMPAAAPGQARGSTSASGSAAATPGSLMAPNSAARKAPSSGVTATSARESGQYHR